MTMTKVFAKRDSKGPRIVILSLLLLCAIPLLVTAGANAAPVTYNLVGVTLSDGATASGSFDYDAATNTYSNVNVTTTAGTRPSATYTAVSNGFAPDSGGVLFVTTPGNATGLPGLTLLFSPILPGPGGVSNVSGQEATCADAGCTAPTGTIRTITGGTVSSQTAGAPKTWFLSGVTFGDGGTATGSFTFNPATNQYTNVNITTSGGTRPPATYTSVSNGLVADSTQVLFVTSAAANQTGQPGLAMFFGTPLSTAAGISSVTGQEATCGDADCTTPTGVMRTITAGNVVTPADISITKTNNAGAVNAGGTTSYTVVVTNTGPLAANGAVFTDPAAAGLTATNVACGSATGGAACPAAGNSTVALMQGAGIVIPTLPSGGSVTFTITANVTATSGTVTNTAFIAAPAGIIDPNGANNTQADVDTVTPVADLSITKTNGVNSVGPGSTTAYTIVVTNTGPSSANGAVFTDPAVAGLTATSVTCGNATGGATCSTAGNTTVPLMQGAGIVIPTLPSGGSVTFTVNANVTAAGGGTVTNTASIAAPAGTIDPIGGNNTVSDIDNVAAVNTTLTILSDTPDPSQFGVPVNVAVSIVAPGAGTPNGNVIITESGGPATCTITLSNGGGACQITPSTVGAMTFTATYAGNASFNASTDTEPHTVVKASTTVTVVDAPDPSAVGQNYTVTATVNVPGGGTPTGTINVSDHQGATCTIILPATSCTLTGATAGVRTVTATYSGDARFNPSAGSVSHTVNRANTTVAITAVAPEPSLVNTPYTVFFTVNSPAGTPTGTVTVSDGTGATCTAPVAQGSCSLISTSAGTKTITATYNGDANFNASTSPGFQHVVTAVQGPLGAGIEGDINRPVGQEGTPGPGDGVVDLRDLFWYDRFSRLLNCPAETPNEFQRLDGNDNGFIDGGDYNVIFNTFLGLQPPVQAKGPTQRPAGLCTGVPTRSARDGADPIGDVKPKAPGEVERKSRAMRIISTSGKAGDDILVSIEMDADGTEMMTSTTLRFDPEVLSISDVSGIDANPDVTSGRHSDKRQRIGVNARGVRNGSLGLAIDFSAGTGQPISRGARQIVTLRFRIRDAAKVGTTEIVFADTVLPQVMVDTRGVMLEVQQRQKGLVTISEGTVSVVGFLRDSLSSRSRGYTLGLK